VGLLELVMEILQICFITIPPFIGLYLIFRLLLFVFERIHYSFLQSSIIVLASIVLSFEPLILGLNVSTLPLFSFHNWAVNLHSVGLMIPLIVTMRCLRKTNIVFSQLVFGIIAVTATAYFVTIPIPEKGIVSTFPFFLFPPFIAALVAFLSMEDEHDVQNAIVLSYVTSIIGVFIGADLLHLPSLLLSDAPVPMQAVIGGAAALDLIYLSGVASVLVFTLLQIVMAHISDFERKHMQTYMHLHH
jgi:hypothetical protein